MTLSKAEWRAVRPDRLRNLDAAKLMEALRKRPGDRIEDWQEHLEMCDALEFTLKRTPRMLGRAMTGAYRTALDVWQEDIDDLRKKGAAMLDELALRHVDEVCSRIAGDIETEVHDMVAAAEARIRAEQKRAAEMRDRAAYERAVSDLAERHEMIRLLRRQKMRARLRDDRIAEEMIRAKHVQMRKVKLSCDGMLKGLMKALADAQRDYGKLMGEGPKVLHRTKRREVP